MAACQSSTDTAGINAAAAAKVAMLAHDKMDEALVKIFSRFEEYKARHDLVVIEGTHEGARAHLEAEHL